MKILLFIVLLFIPLFVFSETYEDVAGSSQMVADSFGELWTFFFDDVPSLFQRFFTFVYEYAFKLKLYITELTLKASWAIAKQIIESFQIMSLITANITALSPDLRQVLIDMRLFDGINLLIQAQVTRFVLRS
jgi:hypothetical protein